MNVKEVLLRNCINRCVSLEGVLDFKRIIRGLNMEEPVPESIDVAELGQMRRELMRILDEADPQRHSAYREDVCRRIQRLCRDRVIPDPIGDFMHIVRKCRNRAEYEDCVPQGMEARAIRSAWAAIEDWRLRRARLAATSAENRRTTKEATV